MTVTLCFPVVRKPRPAYSASLLVALAELHDRQFAQAPEGTMGHAMNWDARLPTRAFWLVAGIHRYRDGRRPTKHCASFDVKADALAFAGRWRLNCPDDELAVLVADVEWRPFIPETKTDRAAMAKVTGSPAAPESPGDVPKPSEPTSDPPDGPQAA